MHLLLSVADSDLLEEWIYPRRVGDVFVIPLHKKEKRKM
jgi:hypothetical protein